MASRLELFKAVGMIKNGPDLDKHTHRAYSDLALTIWKDNLEKAPHGHPWHTSFHGSAFPGGEKSCGRKAIYTLMDIPEAEPASPMLVATAEMGKAAENQILYRWGKADLLIAGTPPAKDGEAGKQPRFADDETWLSGAVDAILGLPDFGYVLPVDVKSKAHAVIEQMKAGSKSYQLEHYGQVQAYLYLCTKFYDNFDWADRGFEKPIGATIYYVSRDNPRFTHEFFVDIDWDFINNGVKNLLSWKEHFLNGTIPPRDKSWKWTEDPCKWCKFKKFACKPDNKAGTVNIEDSLSINFARTLREYDIESVKKGVLKRWNLT